MSVPLTLVLMACAKTEIIGIRVSVMMDGLGITATLVNK